MSWFVPGHIANEWQLLACNRSAGVLSPRRWFLPRRSIWPAPPPGHPCLLLTCGDHLILYQLLACGSVWIACVFAAPLEAVTLGGKKRQEGRERQFSANRGFTSLSGRAMWGECSPSHSYPPTHTPPCGWVLCRSLLKLSLFCDSISLFRPRSGHTYRPVSNHGSNPWPSVWPWQVSNFFKPLWPF